MSDYAQDLISRDAAVSANGQVRLVSGLLIVALSVSLVGLQPLAPIERSNIALYDATGSSARQVVIVLIYISLFLLAFVRRTAAVLVPPSAVIVTLAWCFVSIAWSAYPEISFRRLALTSIAISMAFAFVGMLGAQKTLSTCTHTLTVLMVGSLLAGVLSHNAIHQPGEPAEIVGAWRGLFAHKNNAGYAAAVCVLLNVHFLHKFGGVVYYVGLACALAMLALSESKTAGGLLVVCLVVYEVIRVQIALPHWRTMFVLVVFYLLLVVVFLLFIGHAEISAILEDPTSFTNRALIWQVVFKIFADSPFLGAGYGAVWEVEGTVLLQFLFGTQLGANQGHNGFLDLMASIGLPGLIFSIIAFFIVPFVRTINCREQDRDLTAIIVTLMLLMFLHNFMESSLLRYFQAPWIVLLLANALAMQQQKTKKDQHVDFH